jgi:two-component system nitrate/nitrite response regulator NarL
VATVTASTLVADDHAPTRDDVAAALRRDGRFVVVAVVADAASAVDATLRLRPDMCLLDVRMPGSGIGAAWEITARLPATRVVMLTVSRDDRDLFAALRAGAVGYLLKDTPPERIPDTVAPVLRGEVTMPATLVARLMEEFRDRAPRRRAIVQSVGGSRLTSREWEVLDLMRDDLSTAQIARRLFVSDGTVRSHIASALRKLRVPDRDAALRLLDPAGR